MLCLKFFILVSIIYLHIMSFATSKASEFTFNGFKKANLSLKGVATVTPNGLLKISNNSLREIGHAFVPSPIQFKNSVNGSAFSFSTSFVFAVVAQIPALRGIGFVFVLSPSLDIQGDFLYFGFFNRTNDGNFSNHAVAVEFDTFKDLQFGDIDDNHVGIDINGVESIAAKTARYYQNLKFHNLSLSSGELMQVWIEYDGVAKAINVTLAPLHASKPNLPLLSKSYDLSPILKQNMYAGFSSSTGPLVPVTRYVLGWSFKINGTAEIDLSALPELPRVGPKKAPMFLTVGLPVVSSVLLIVVVLGVVYFVMRKRKFAELLEDWELHYTPQRFKYKDLYVATKGFKDKGLLGKGGFGEVYKGVMPTTNIEVAIKRVSHGSGQGMREFVAEIASIGRMRHRNLVPLLGYCRRKRELLLVYEYMPNGSLDRFIYDQPKISLSWNQRFRVIKGVASGLVYLHEQWEQVVIHRDIKASNVLLDDELNGRLGDFGLARLYDHGTDPQTTHIVGTLGYLAPEHNRTGKATKATDVYAFGAFLLEVACGRRPIQCRASAENIILVDQVFSCWIRGEILQAIDPNLGSEYVKEEVELILKLGLLCSHSNPVVRPSMAQVVQYLEGTFSLPELSSLGISTSGMAFGHYEGFDNVAMHFTSSTPMQFSSSTYSSSVVNSVLSGGR